VLTDSAYVQNSQTCVLFNGMFHSGVDLYQHADSRKVEKKKDEPPSS
jgi:hypothetical protein